MSLTLTNIIIINGNMIMMLIMMMMMIFVILHTVSEWKNREREREWMKYVAMMIKQINNPIEWNEIIVVVDASSYYSTLCLRFFFWILVFTFWMNKRFIQDFFLQTKKKVENIKIKFLDLLILVVEIFNLSNQMTN